MNIKLPAGKNIPKNDILNYKKHVQNILNQKVVLENSIQDKKMAINEINNIKNSKLN
jgi:chaperonin cofactor prefoldin